MLWAFRSPIEKRERYFSHLWPQIPPINLVFGGSFSHREPRRSLRSSPRRQKRTTPRQRTPRQRRRARRLRLGPFFFVGHRNPPAAFDFFFCGGLSCRPLCGARSFSFPSSSTKAARTKRRPRRPPQKEPGSGRDAIISIVVVVSLRAGSRPTKLLWRVLQTHNTDKKATFTEFFWNAKSAKGKE